jgi:hypothetical protein
VREAALDGAKRLEVVLVVVVGVGRRPDADRARLGGAVPRVGRRRRGPGEAEALADAADEGEVLVVRGIVRRHRGRGRGGGGAGEVGGRGGGELRDGGVRVRAGEDAGAAQRVEVLLQVGVEVGVRVVGVEVHRGGRPAGRRGGGGALRARESREGGADLNPPRDRGRGKTQRRRISFWFVSCA